MSTTWSLVTMAAMIGGIAVLLSLYEKFLESRVGTPEQVREAGETFFTGRAKVTVSLGTTGLNREQLARLALEKGYEFKSVDNQGRQGVFFTFLHKGPHAEPAPFLPESPGYAAQMEQEAQWRRRNGWIKVGLCVGLVGVTTLVALAG